MPLIEYESHAFRPETLAIIERAETICQQYAAQGFTLSLRQLYYQFVARGLIENKQSEYKRLGKIIGQARLAGMLDWEWLEDRGREVDELSHWTSPRQILQAVGEQYRVDKWLSQPYRPMVMVEKDALTGVLRPICQGLDVPLLACKGYPSLSTLWRIGDGRLSPYIENGQVPLILHFGDHDPSGLNMTGDLVKRLALFAGEDVEVRRLALNIDQVQQYQPPPNPAKETDSRFIEYADLYGDESWELDALEPTVLANLVEEAILSVRDHDLWDQAEAEEGEERRRLMAVAQRWDDVRSLVEAD